MKVFYLKFKGSGLLLVAISMFIAFSCSKKERDIVPPGDDNNEQQDTTATEPVDTTDQVPDGALVLTPSYTSVDEGDTVFFTVSVDGNPVTDADIYLDGNKLAEDQYVFDKSSVHKAIAKKDGMEDSKEVEIKVYQVDVYVAGVDNSGPSLGSGTTKIQGKYWKIDGQTGAVTEVALNDPSNTNTTHANAIYVTENGDVYVGGEEFISGKYKARYWKNGATGGAIFDGLGNDMGTHSYISAIGVLNGVVYVGGRSWVTDRDAAKIFIDNNGTIRLDYLAQSKTAIKGIFVHNNDIYFTGYTGGAIGGNAALWKKSGDSYDYTQISTDDHVVATGLWVTNKDIYISGYKTGDGYAKYWSVTGGANVDFPNDNKDEEAFSIAATEAGKVYVAGGEGPYDQTKSADEYFNGVSGVYWDPLGNRHRVGDDNNPSAAYSIAVSGAENVYVAGAEQVGGVWYAKYWKNGKEVVLSDGAYDAQATSIFVKRTLVP